MPFLKCDWSCMDGAAVATFWSFWKRVIPPADVVLVLLRLTASLFLDQLVGNAREKNLRLCILCLLKWRRKRERERDTRSCDFGLVASTVLTTRMDWLARPAGMCPSRDQLVCTENSIRNWSTTQNNIGEGKINGHYYAKPKFNIGNIIRTIGRFHKSLPTLRPLVWCRARPVISCGTKSYRRSFWPYILANHLLLDIQSIGVWRTASFSE